MKNNNNENNISNENANSKWLMIMKIIVIMWRNDNNGKQWQ